ncbi:hypothetical protein SCHPADRAFT_995222 [Schizopora paradoxa]|uniref:Uncharacterized protein n=1 Tax=Schizopora paradoxa TaxID=27342 RepID=A0A0H2S3B0_9AGAM|nr:hypothetical protein SCHPADRAFT_995222 [Schizopora paradoxa]
MPDIEWITQARPREEDSLDGRRAHSLCSDSTEARNTAKELLASLISAFELSYEAAEHILSAIKEESFTFEDVHYQELVVEDGDTSENKKTGTQMSLANSSAFLQRISNNRSEKLLASLVENGSLSVKGIGRILIAIRSGTFEAGDLTFESLESLVFHPLKIRQNVLFHNKRSPLSGFTQSIPRIVLQELIDLLAAVVFPSTSSVDEGVVRVLPGSTFRPSRSSSDEAMRTLKCLALVHPSWTSMVYRALGKHLTVPYAYKNEQLSPWTAYIQNPRYGAWTKELAFIVTSNTLKSAGIRRSFFVANIHRRFPNLRTVHVHFYRLHEDATNTLKILTRLKMMTDLNIELGSSEQVPKKNDVSPPWSSFFETLARLPQLRTLQIPCCRNRIQGLKIPSDFIPLTTNRKFEKLRISVLNLEDTKRSRDYPSLLVWVRQNDDAKDAFGLTTLQLCQLPNSFQTFSDMDKSTLTSLHVVCTEVVPWNREDHDLKSFTSLQKVEVVSEMPFIDVILKSMPRALESLLIVFPRTMEYSEVDKMLEGYIASRRFPSLKQLRVARSYFRDKPYAFRKMKISSSIPLTAAACQGRNIEYGAWF